MFDQYPRQYRAGRRILRLRTKDNSVRYARGTGIQLAADAAHPVQLDGDEFGEARSVHTWVDPGALTVKMPAAE